VSSTAAASRRAERAHRRTKDEKKANGTGLSMESPGKSAAWPMQAVAQE